MFTNFPFVPTINQGFLCLINLAFIQLKNCSFIEIMTIPTQNEAVWLLYLLPCWFSWRPAMLRNYTTDSFHSGPFRVFKFKNPSCWLTCINSSNFPVFLCIYVFSRSSEIWLTEKNHIYLRYTVQCFDICIYYKIQQSS